MESGSNNAAVEQAVMRASSRDCKIDEVGGTQAGVDQLIRLGMSQSGTRRCCKDSAVVAVVGTERVLWTCGRGAWADDGKLETDVVDGEKLAGSAWGEVETTVRCAAAAVMTGDILLAAAEEVSAWGSWSSA
jgi:hypothetical protein